MRCLIISAVMLPLLATCGYAQRVSVAWQRQELGKAFERLTESASLELWLDRRVDPSQRVDTKFDNVLVEDAINELARRYGLETLRVGQLVYVGPPRMARGLAALLLESRAAAAKAVPKYRRFWQQESPLGWPRLTQPRQFLEKLLKDAGIEAAGLERVPFDLWPRREFSPMSRADQVVLILAGFDLRCEIADGGRRCRIVPIEFPLPNQTDKLQTKRPRRMPSGSGRPTTSLFSLKLENQRVDQVVKQLAAQLEYDVVWDEKSLTAHQRSKDALVTCEVKNVALGELLAAILGPAGMTSELKAGTLTIRGVAGSD